MVQVKELIVSDLTRKGSGQSVFSPVRQVIEVYSKEGDLLAFHDKFGNFSIEDLFEFGNLCLSNKALSVEEIFHIVLPAHSTFSKVRMLIVLC